MTGYDPISGLGIWQWCLLGVVAWIVGSAVWGLIWWLTKGPS